MGALKIKNDIKNMLAGRRRDSIKWLTKSVGSLEYHEGFWSKGLGNTRGIRVYLPPDYAHKTAKRYPVLYMQDGNIIFDTSNSLVGNKWELNKTIDTLIASKKIQEIIIVGIYNTPQRVEDYTTSPVLPGFGGKAMVYGELVVKKIKPFIDKTYRTLADRDHTAIMGVSLGGLAAFSIAYQYPDVFGMVGGMSAYLGWAEGDMLQKILNEVNIVFRKLWIDVGMAEEDGFIQDARVLKDFYQQNGYQLGNNLGYYEEEGAEHNSNAWAKRVWRPLEFFFGLKNDK